MFQYILNNTRSQKERWRILSGGLGFSGEPEDSPLHHFRIAFGPKRKNAVGDYVYQTEMSLFCFFKEARDWPVPPLNVRKNARDWLVGNRYGDWLKRNNLFTIER